MNDMTTFIARMNHEGGRQKHSSRTEEIQSIFRSDNALIQETGKRMLIPF